MASSGALVEVGNEKELAKAINCVISRQVSFDSENLVNRSYDFADTLIADKYLKALLSK